MGRRVASYDILSRCYSLLADPSEGPLRRQCVDRLRLKPGETVLDVGSGPGSDLTAVASMLGQGGRVYGLDLSRRMLRECQRRLSGAAPPPRVVLVQGDGARLPFQDHGFDAILLSFTLELFPERKMRQVLQEVARALRKDGRLGVVSLSNLHPEELPTRLYWHAHRAMPQLIDCRPIDAPGILCGQGFEIAEAEERSMWGLRVSIVVARKRQGSVG
jgi:ubiquinone/menaquinone biosynthesis C-methylase UbiE